MHFSTTIYAAIVLSISCFSFSEACLRGLSWGIDDSLGPKLSKGLVSWYWHWQDGPNKHFDGKLEFVPCFWGPKYWDKWNQRKQEMNKTLPKHILAFNEPEIPGQANMGAKQAAKLFKQEIQPYANKGVKLGSPQMVYKLDWLVDFMDECDKLGCTIDFIALHWYGTHKDLSALKKWISSVHKKFNKPIWITEYGITSAAGASQSDIKNFHMKATAWMSKVGYVERASWLGCFKVNSPPDSYASNKNAFFNSNNSLRDLAYWYLYTENANKRSHSNRVLPGVVHARRGIKHVDEDGLDIIDDEDTFEPYQDVVDCDDYCQNRKAAIAKIEEQLGPVLDDDEDDEGPSFTTTTHSPNLTESITSSSRGSVHLGLQGVEGTILSTQWRYTSRQPDDSFTLQHGQPFPLLTATKPTPRPPAQEKSIGRAVASSLKYLREEKEDVQVPLELLTHLIADDMQQRRGQSDKELLVVTRDGCIVTPGGEDDTHLYLMSLEAAQDGNWRVQVPNKEVRSFTSPILQIVEGQDCIAVRTFTEVRILSLFPTRTIQKLSGSFEHILFSGSTLYLIDRNGQLSTFKDGTITALPLLEDSYTKYELRTGRFQLVHISSNRILFSSSRTLFSLESGTLSRLYTTKTSTDTMSKADFTDFCVINNLLVACTTASLLWFQLKEAATPILSYQHRRGPDNSLSINRLPSDSATVLLSSRRNRLLTLYTVHKAEGEGETVLPPQNGGLRLVFGHYPAEIPSALPSKSGVGSKPVLTDWPFAIFERTDRGAVHARLLGWTQPPTASIMVEGALSPLEEIESVTVTTSYANLSSIYEAAIKDTLNRSLHPQEVEPAEIQLDTTPYTSISKAGQGDSLPPRSHTRPDTPLTLLTSLMERYTTDPRNRNLLPILRHLCPTPSPQMEMDLLLSSPLILPPSTSTPSAGQHGNWLPPLEETPPQPPSPSTTFTFFNPKKFTHTTTSKLLLHEWPQGAKAEEYRYQDPYADLLWPRRGRSRSVSETLGSSRASSRAPTAVSQSQRAPPSVAVASQRVQSQRVPPSVASQVSTQVLPGKFGGRTTSKKEKEKGKKRVGGF